jgi:hypothetical protein
MTNRTFKSGESREQGCLLPARVEDYVEPDNPVQRSTASWAVLDLAKLGFRHAKRGVGAKLGRVSAARTMKSCPLLAL